MRGMPSPSLSSSPGTAELNVAGTERERGREREREPSVKVNKKHTQTDEKLCRALKRDSGGGRVEEKGIRGETGERRGTACCLLSVASAVTNEQTAHGQRRGRRNVQHSYVMLYGASVGNTHNVMAFLCCIT